MYETKIKLDDIFDAFYSGDWFGDYTTPKKTSPSKIENLEDKTVITTDLPGYKKENIKITTTARELNVVVDGVRGKKNYKYKLNEVADYKAISSTFEDGVLTIVVPFKSEAAAIDIKVQ